MKNSDEQRKIPYSFIIFFYKIKQFKLQWVKLERGGVERRGGGWGH